MKHSGRARQAAFKIIVISLIAVLIVWGSDRIRTVMVVVLGAGALAVDAFRYRSLGAVRRFYVVFLSRS